MSIFNYPHPQSVAAKFTVDFFDEAGNPIPCPQYECYHSTDNGDIGANNFVTTPNEADDYNPNAEGSFPDTYPVTYSNWNDVTVDLTAYADQIISARFRVDWGGINNADWAYVLIDADCPINNYNPEFICERLSPSICGPINNMLPPLSWNIYTPASILTATATASCITPSIAGFYIYGLETTNVQCSAGVPFTFGYFVSESPTINITSNAVCLNGITSFTNTSSISAPDVITTCVWDFENDGVPDNITAEPSTTYPAAGIYTVGLTVTATNGCKTTATIQTTVYDNSININIASNAVCLNSSTSFTNTSSCNINSG